MRNPYQAIDGVEGVEGIEKCERFVYSVDSGISLKRKGLLKSQGSSPFFGTNLFCISLKTELITFPYSQARYAQNGAFKPFCITMSRSHYQALAVGISSKLTTPSRRDFSVR
jgi:hypothetical protein